MKKIIGLSALAIFFLSFFWTCVCFSGIQVLEKNEKGEFRAHENFWRISSIRAEAEALDFLDRFAEAIKDPNHLITVWREEQVVGLKPMFNKVLEIKEKRIIYDENKEMIKYHKLAHREIRASGAVKLFWLSIILMILSNIFFYRNQEKGDLLSRIFRAATFIMSFLSAIIILLFYYFSAVTIVFGYGFFLFFLFIITAHVAISLFCALLGSAGKKERSNYQICSFTYYLVTIVSFFTLFIF